MGRGIFRVLPGNTNAAIAAVQAAGGTVTAVTPWPRDNNPDSGIRVGSLDAHHRAFRDDADRDMVAIGCDLTGRAFHRALVAAGVIPGRDV